MSDWNTASAQPTDELANQREYWRYIPRLVRAWHRDQPGVTHRTVQGTMVFADGSGFTALTERLSRHGRVGSEDVSALLNHYFTRVLAAAVGEGGDLLKFGGDAVLLLFEGPGHATRACRAAAAMRRAVRGTSALKTAAGAARMTFSVGIHSGDFEMFLVGESHRELLVTGHGLGQVLAMEYAANGGEILVSDETGAMLPARCLGEGRAGGRLLVHAPKPAPIPAQGFPEMDELGALIPECLRGAAGTAAGEGEHRRATVGFLNFAGTDAVLEEEGPEALAARLAETVAGAQDVCREFDVCFLATDVNANGGKIILVSGVPESTEADEEQLLLALRAILDRGLPLPLRAGVTRGPVFAGDIGADFRRTYTIIGDAVNLAARLMARAEPGQLLATRDVLARSQTAFETTAVAPFAAKGKSLPVEAVAVGRATGRRLDGNQTLDLVGRDEELRQLASAFALVRSGVGNAVRVSGETGIGKTRLIQEALTFGRDIPQLTVVSSQYAKRSPYFTFRVLLREAFGIDAAAGPETAADALRERVRERAAAELPWLPLVAMVMDLPVAMTPEVEAIEPQYRPALAHQAIVRLLATLRPGRQVLVFEEVMWMDDASGGLVREIARATREHPWLVMVADHGGASGEDDMLAAAETVLRIALQPLGPEAVEQLARMAANRLGRPATGLSDLGERSAGHPLFLLELIRTEGDDGSLPETLELAITARIDELTPADRKVLRHASVLGTVFQPGAIRRAFGQSDPFFRIEPAWHRLQSFLEPAGGDTYQFRHRLFRDVAYGGLPFRRRTALHLDVLNALEEDAGAAVESVAELLAIHAERAEDAARTWRYGVVAGDRARGKFANVEASEFYAGALVAAKQLDVPAGDVARVAESHGDVLEQSGQYDAADKAYAAACAAAPSLVGMAHRIQVKRGLLREKAGHHSRALAWFTRALRDERPPSRDERVDPDDRVELLTAIAGVRLRQGKYGEALRWCREAVALGERTGARVALAHALTLLDSTLELVQDPAAGTYMPRAIPILEAAGRFARLADAYNNMGNQAYYHGDWPEAERLWRLAQEQYRKAGHVEGDALTRNNIAEILSDSGRYAEAEDDFREAEAIFLRSGHATGLAFVRSNLGRLATRRGDFEAATGLLAAAHEEFQKMGNQVLAADVESRMAENLLASGNIGEAIAQCDATLARIRGQAGTSLTAATLHRTRGLALSQANAIEDARAALAESLAIFNAAGATAESQATERAMAALP